MKKEVISHKLTLTLKIKFPIELLFQNYLRIEAQFATRLTDKKKKQTIFRIQVNISKHLLKKAYAQEKENSEIERFQFNSMDREFRINLR